MEPFLQQGLIEKLKQREIHLIESLLDIIRIPSVTEEASTLFPFGQNIDRALKKTLDICEAMGFRVYYDPEGYYGYAEIGDGEELIGVLGHLDVVPAGSLDDWSHDPFQPIISEGNLYGRGTQDDKGPLFACLYAARALMDLQVPFHRRLRFIFGTDEETLWRCMKKYMEKEEIPSFGFTPDSRFPLIHAEKGLLQIRLKGKRESSIILQGGHSFNTVPDHVVYSGQMLEELKIKLKELNYSYEDAEDGIKVFGKAAHSQSAEQGVNAVNRLAIALKEIGMESKAIRFIANEIKEDPFATAIFGNCEDEVSGRLKFNVGKINISENEEELSIDIRIPVTVPKSFIIEQLEQAAQKYELAFQEHDWLKPIYIPREHFLVKTLMQVYQEVTADFESDPIASGGATYARAMDNCIAFGALFPNSKKLAHLPNEHIVLEELYCAMEIYAKAIYRLTRKGTPS